MGLKVEINDASCSNFTYSITASPKEALKLSPYAIVKINETLHNFTLPSMQPPFENSPSGQYDVQGNIAFGNASLSNGLFELQIELFGLANSTESIATGNDTAICSRNDDDTTTSTATVSSSVISTQKGVSSLSLALPSDTSIATSTSIFEPTTDSHNDGVRDNLQLKEGLSVGILSIALFFVVFLGCMLIKRRKNLKQYRMQKGNDIEREQWRDNKSTESLASIYQR